MNKQILDYIKNNHPNYSELSSYFFDLDMKKELLILEQDGLIDKIKDKYYLSKELNLVPATITSIKEKFSFANISEDEDVYISNNNLKNAFKDDKVLLKKISNRYDVRDEFEVIKITKRARNILTGEVVISGGIKILKIEKIADPSFLFLIKDENLKVNKNQIIKAKIKKISVKTCIVEPIEIIGNKFDIGMDVTRIILTNGSPIEFSNEVKQEIKELPSKINNDEKIGREDFTDHLIVTIDGDDAKDFDDAVEVALVDDIYYVGVHIADVAHYVKENTALDKEALTRATSLYVQDRVVPMLPFELSNGICSLNPMQDRLVTSCLFSISKQGEILTTHICKGIIRSKHRLTYNYVNNFLNKERYTKTKFSQLEEMLINLKDVADIIRNIRNKQGALNLVSTELSFKIGEDGNPYDVNKRHQDVGEELIEDLMIKANEIVSSTIEKMKLPMIYRIHENPRSKRLQQFKLVSEFKGYHFDLDPLTCTPLQISNYLKTINNQSDKEILSSLLLRCLAKAKYSIQNKKHFGLASSSYTHFTSPIRRYPDLLVHRLIDRYIIEKNISTNDEFVVSLSQKAQLCSERERRSLQIERSVDDLLSAKYMLNHLGDEYESTIVSMIQQGIFVEIENGIQGFIPFDSIPGDYYIFDEEIFCAYGKRKGRKFSLGDKVRVILTNVDIEHPQITFSLISKMKYNNHNLKQKKGRKYGRAN